jgi:hypothetical protein
VRVEIPQTLVSMIVLCGSLISYIAKADTITFNGIVSQPYVSGAVPDGFDGYQWQNFSVFASTGCAGVKYEFTSTGYCRLTDATGITSEAYLFGNDGSTFLGTFSSDQPFNLDSGIFAAAWNKRCDDDSHRV